MNLQPIVSKASLEIQNTPKLLVLPKVSSKTEVKSKLTYRTRNKLKTVKYSYSRILNQRNNEDWLHITWDYINACNVHPSSKRAIFYRQLLTLILTLSLHN